MDSILLFFIVTLDEFILKLSIFDEAVKLSNTRLVLLEISNSRKSCSSEGEFSVQFFRKALFCWFISPALHSIS